MIKKILLFCLAFYILLACNSEEFNKPSISLLSMNPNDTLLRGEALNFVFELKDIDANTDILFYKKIYTDRADTLKDSLIIPKSSFVVREGELTFTLLNLQTSQSYSVLKDPTPNRNYTAKYEIWVTDKTGYKSNVITTSTIFVKTQ